MTLAEIADVHWHDRAVLGFDAVVRQVQPDQWRLPTPCAEWDVRALVNHVLAEARWTPPRKAGEVVAEVGGSLGGLPSGDVPALEHLRRLTAEYLVHAWDVAVAIGTDVRLDPELVEVVAAWFTSQAAVYRNAGAVASPVAVGPDECPQRRLLAEFGRDAGRSATLAAVARFAAAFERRDIDAVMAAMTEDCIFESTAPPDGKWHQGQTSVRAAWAEFFAAAGEIAFDTEEQIVCADRVITRWRYAWGGGHIRGVDIYRVSNGHVAEKLAYVKG